MRLFLEDAVLYGVFNIIYQMYSGMFKIYLTIFILVKHVNNPGILKNLLLQRCPGIL